MATMLPDSDPVSFTRFLLASGTVIVLIMAMAWGMKLLNEKGLARFLPGTSAPRRLKHVETLPLDARRRLVIVQCDQRQYLMLLGATQDIVVDISLQPATPSTTEESSSHEIKAS
jgi:flagellar protein FliO/FliZ